MPPIVKDAENSVATATTNLAASPAARSTSEPQARPQPVALEIPVTVNGARTVVGSDKREPFSESSNTVLVFANGAVVRLVSSLAAGQLIFLTNEKSKKEVVCQVVKSKNDGTSAGYVELKFTEPAAGFWGMRFPAEPVAASPVAPAAPRTLAPAVPAAPKLAPPPAPVAAKPTAAPVTPAVVPSKPALVPPPAPLVKPEPLEIPAPVSTVVAAPAPPVVIPAPIELPPPPPVSVVVVHPAAPESAPVSVVPEATVVSPPAPVAVISAPIELPPAAPVALDLASLQTSSPEPVSIVPETPVAPPPAPPAAVIPEPISAPPRIDFGAKILSLFAASPLPATEPLPSALPELKPVAESSEPTSDQLRQQTAHIQEQLSSLLFTDASVIPPAPPSASAPVASDTAQKLFERAEPEPKPEIKPEIKRDPKPSAALIKLASTSLAAEEEVKIPSWLAPLSPENAAVVTESATVVPSSSGSDSLPAYIESSEKSLSSVGEEVPHRSRAAVFGGQLTGESAEDPAGVLTRSSKKGLFLGLAAGILLLLGGGIWYLQNAGYLQLIPRSTQAAAVRPAKALPPVSNAPTSSPEPQHVSSSVIPAPVPSTPETPIAKPAASPVFQSASSNVATHNIPPAEQPTKQAFGNVHLAAPVVSRSATSSQAGDPDLVIDSSEAASGDAPIGGLAGAHPKGPEAPPTPVIVGGDVKPAQVLRAVPPVYPQMAKAQRLSGDVRIDALIDDAGNVTTMKVLSGPPIFHQAALAALKQWKYQPAQLDGKPTSMHLTVTVQFHLQ